MSTWTITIRTTGSDDQQVGDCIASDDLDYVVGPLVRTLAIVPGISDAWIDGDVTLVLADDRAVVIEPRSDDIPDAEYDRAIDVLAGLVVSYSK